MRRFLLVCFLTVPLYGAGLVLLVIAARTLAIVAGDGLVNAFLALGLALLVTLTPFVPGRTLTPFVPSRLLQGPRPMPRPAGPSCPHCGGILGVAAPAKPDPTWRA